MAETGRCWDKLAVIGARQSGTTSPRGRPRGDGQCSPEHVWPASCLRGSCQGAGCRCRRWAL